MATPVIPQGDGPTAQVSVRLPEKLIEKLDAVAAATGNTRSDVVLHALRWAMEEYDRQRQDSKAKKA